MHIPGPPSPEIPLAALIDDSDHFLAFWLRSSVIDDSGRSVPLNPLWKTCDFCPASPASSPRSPPVHIPFHPKLHTVSPPPCLLPHSHSFWVQLIPPYLKTSWYPHVSSLLSVFLYVSAFQAHTAYKVWGFTGIAPLEGKPCLICLFSIPSIWHLAKHIGDTLKVFIRLSFACALVIYYICIF